MPLTPHPAGLHPSQLGGSASLLALSGALGGVPPHLAGKDGGDKKPHLSGPDSHSAGPDHLRGEQLYPITETKLVYNTYIHTYYTYNIIFVLAWGLPLIILSCHSGQTVFIKDAFLMYLWLYHTFLNCFYHHLLLLFSALLNAPPCDLNRIYAFPTAIEREPGTVSTSSFCNNVYCSNKQLCLFFRGLVCGN